MKQDLLSKVLIFATGAAVGSAVTWFVMKKKYEEVEYEYIGEDSEDTSGDDEEPTNDIPKQDSEKDRVDQNKVAYNKIIKDAGYSNEEIPTDKSMPYVITSEEYAEIEEYEAIALYYYTDGVLTDEYDNIVEDINDVVGEDSLTLFDDIEIDTVYVRNDERRSDYEIHRFRGAYSDLYSTEV